MEPTQERAGAADEIDLFDLIDDIKAKWYWLIGTVVAVVCLAVIYLLLVRPVYQTEVVYKSVSPADLLPLNQPRLKSVLAAKEGEPFMTPETAFKSVRAKALSGGVMRSFYDQLLESSNDQLKPLIYDETITPEQNYSKFVGLFSHSDPGAKDADLFLKLTLELPDAGLSADVLNLFSEYLLTRNREEMINAVKQQISAHLDEWQMQAEEMRTTYKAAKELRLRELREAADIAHSINQQKPVFSGERVVVSDAPPLYMMGEKALRAEISQLQARAEKDEDLYIEGLPELLWKVDTVKNTAIDWDNVRFAEVDEPAVVPLKPIKPRKMLVLALAVVAGGMAGILFALLSAAQQRRRERLNSQN